MKGDKIKCCFDGDLVMEDTDDTFPNIGKIGCWTKADAITYFDNIVVKLF